MSKILIAVCTYLRPKMLEKALISITKLVPIDDVEIEVLIVDNDKNESAKSIVEKATADFPYKIYYKVQPERGLSAARNKVLMSAMELKADFIACFDDDDSPDSNWLYELWQFEKAYKEKTGKDVIVTGPTFCRFDKKYPKYITMNFRTKTSKKTGQLRNTAATGNVLIPIDVVKLGIFFDECYKFMGGEDGEFFQKAKMKGFEIYWCNEAIVYENITNEKANLNWILKRYFYNGFSNVFFKLKKDNNIKYKSKILIKAIINICICTLVMPFSVVAGRVGLIGVLSSILKSSGKITALYKKEPLNFYQKTVGE